MSQVFAPGLQIKNSVVLRKIRELTIPGEILGKVGENVKAGDIVGTAQRPGDLLILRLPEQMGIEPFEVIKGLRITSGESVTQGQLLCEHAGLFGLLKSRYKAAHSGIIEFITEQTGHLGLRLPSTPLELKAYIDGQIVAVDPTKSLTLETRAAFMQGIFGVGGERYGELLSIAAPDQIVTDAMIPENVAGKILFGGVCADQQVLARASRLGAVGFITGSIDDEALKGYLGYDLGLALTGNESISMSVIITEGFGAIAMAKKAYELLAAQQGKAASINGATQVRAGAIRPEVIISHLDRRDDKAQRLDKGEGLQIGSQVRLIRVPYFGLRGEVIELPSAPETIESGAVTRVLRARLQDGTVVTVPRANVEL